MLSEYIKKKRLENNLSQSDVANAIKVHSRVYQRWEAGEFIPNAENLFNLIDLLNLDVNVVKELIVKQKIEQ
jgi:transcriptional regulator with XRE-family HTH domain